MRFYILCSIISICRTVPLNNNESKAKYSFESGKKIILNKEKSTLIKIWDKETSLMDMNLKLTDAEIQYYKLWPQGAISYYIDTFSYKDKILRDRIRNFLSDVNSLTNINFMELPSPPADEETRWVFFVNRRGLLGCADHSVANFTTKGVQHVVLGYDCLVTGNELAEAVLSILGIPAQHNAPNRDEYIEVITENILPEKLYLFNKIKEKDWIVGTGDYDFKSASHFDTHKHSRNGKATIRIKEKEIYTLSSENKLSAGDINNMIWVRVYSTSKKTRTLAECQKLLHIHGPVEKQCFLLDYIFGNTYNTYNINVNVKDSNVNLVSGGCGDGGCKKGIGAYIGGFIGGSVDTVFSWLGK